MSKIIDVVVVEEPEEPLLYADRTGMTTDWSCGMKYWWARKESGQGISPIKEAAALTAGRDVHEDLSEIAALDDSDLTPEGLDGIISEILAASPSPSQTNQAAMEVLYRRLGWLAAFGLFVEPLIRRDFENVQTEAEIILDREPLWFAVTPDRLLRHKKDGYLVYKEWKSTISAGPKWLSHWQYAVQVHLGLMAIQEELQEKVAYGQIVGLIKGMDNYGGRLSHPYVWAYRNGDKWENEYAKARSAGWDHAPIWEYPGGVVEWVQRLGKEVALQQFPHSAPVFLNERMVEDTITTRIAREREIAEVTEDCRIDYQKRLLYFEQRTEQCRPAWGDACPYLAACWNAQINQNPLASGLFQIRQPHHEVEVEFLKGNR